MKRQELEQAFEYIRNSFFPQWDRKRKWRIQEMPGLRLSGRYDDSSKRTLIRHIPENNQEFYLLLIHEIAHCAAIHHGKRFIDRLLKAKIKAEQLGLKTLAEKIGAEITVYSNPERVPPCGYAYSRIEDIVMDVPTISWTDLLKCAADEQGMYPREFLKRYKRAKRVFLSAKKEFARKRGK